MMFRKNYTNNIMIFERNDEKLKNRWNIKNSEKYLSQPFPFHFDWYGKYNDEPEWFQEWMKRRILYFKLMCIKLGYIKNKIKKMGLLELREYFPECDPELEENRKLVINYLKKEFHIKYVYCVSYVHVDEDFTRTRIYYTAYDQQDVFDVCIKKTDRYKNIKKFSIKLKKWYQIWKRY